MAEKQSITSDTRCKDGENGQHHVALLTCLHLIQEMGLREVNALFKAKLDLYTC